MINCDIYPWNRELWEQFCVLRQGATLPHAFLLTGASGVGKKALAAAMAKSLLCEKPQANGEACGYCPSCHWFEAGNHPDLRRVRPAMVAAQEGSADESTENVQNSAVVAPEIASSDKKLSKEITIAQIRALRDFCTLTAVRDGPRIALIYPAEAMNISAANALLKTLEEPGAQFHFFLITEAPHRILPTVRSRCRIWPVKTPDKKTALDWLSHHKVSQIESKLAAIGGAPLEVFELENSSYWKTLDLLLTALSEPRRIDIPGLTKQLETAIKWYEKEHQTGASRVVDLAILMGWLQRWTADVLHCHFEVPIRYYPERHIALERNKEEASLSDWLSYAQWLNRAASDASHPVNMALFLEDCLLRYPAFNFTHKGR
jgi:DNA polymerase-3 subunit delta'